jgi:hypothetical protein
MKGDLVGLGGTKTCLKGALALCYSAGQQAGLFF